MGEMHDDPARRMHGALVWIQAQKGDLSVGTTDPEPDTAQKRNMAYISSCRVIIYNKNHRGQLPRKMVALKVRGVELGGRGWLWGSGRSPVWWGRSRRWSTIN